MELDKEVIGGNIKAARTKKGLTQSALAAKAKMSSTQLSDYENGKKLPGLTSIATIADVLDKTIDDLCYGDESMKPITTAPNVGRLAANCVYQLWRLRLLNTIPEDSEISRYLPRGEMDLDQIADLSYGWRATTRLLDHLNDFRSRNDTFTNPDLYLDQLLDSAANEMNYLLS